MNPPKHADTVTANISPVAIKRIPMKLILLSGNSNSNAGTSGDSGSNTEAKPTSANTTSVSKNCQMVLLQTAHAAALTSPNGFSVPARVLFDSGSQLSYIMERLQWQLNLKPMKIEKFHLNTFGHRSYKTQECAVVCKDFNNSR